MLTRGYKITCDCCGRSLGYYFFDNKRPTADQIRKLFSACVVGEHIFCDENCAAEWKHSITTNRCGNLKQFQPGKKFKRK